MKSVRVSLFFLIAISICSGDDDPFVAVAALFDSAPQHSHAHTAAEVKTLDQILETAMTGNPEIRAAVRRVSLAQTRISGAGSIDDPQLMYRNWGVPLRQPWNWNQSQQMFMFSQNIPGAGKSALRTEIAAKDISIAKADLEAVRRDVQARVRRNFYDLLRNSDERRIHDEQASIAKEGLEAAKVKYVVGRVPQQDVLKAQVALTKLAQHLIDLDQDQDLACASLNTLMGRNPSEPLEIVGDYSLPQQLPALLDLQKTALESRPELIAISRKLEQDDARLRLAEKGYAPDYGVSGGYMLMPAGTGGSRNAYMAELSVSLPWLNRRKHEAEIAEAKAMTSTEQAEFDNRRSQIFMEIQEALIRARAAHRALMLYRTTLMPQAEATLKATSAAYKNDKTDFLNLLDSQNMTLDVQSAYFKSAAEFESRLSDLERATGAAIPRSDSDLRSALEVRR